MKPVNKFKDLIEKVFGRGNSPVNIFEYDKKAAFVHYGFLVVVDENRESGIGKYDIQENGWGNKDVVDGVHAICDMLPIEAIYFLLTDKLDMNFTNTVDSIKLPRYWLTSNRKAINIELIGLNLVESGYQFNYDQCGFSFDKDSQVVRFRALLNKIGLADIPIYMRNYGPTIMMVAPPADGSSDKDQLFCVRDSIDPIEYANFVVSYSYLPNRDDLDVVDMTPQSLLAFICSGTKTMTFGKSSDIFWISDKIVRRSFFYKTVIDLKKVRYFLEEYGFKYTDPE